MKEAIVLAGGLGTRLKSAVPNLPKPMAPVNNKPFLFYLLLHLRKQGCQRVILSVGYKWQLIQDFFGDHFLEMDIIYSIEDTPLGTGGAIKRALQYCKSDWCYVLNGDTYFEADLNWHQPKTNNWKLIAARVQDVSRYGAIQTENNVLTGFSEKGQQGKGYINGGIYFIPKNLLNHITAEKFSFEKLVLEQDISEKSIEVSFSDAYFKDIGIPEDYFEFQQQMTKDITDLNIDKSWTLFLDRDGVINVRLIDDYVKQLNELAIIDGVPEAISVFNNIFKRTVVVTNQQGIGKGMMDENDLEIIHGYMNNVFKDAGGEITKFYFAPQLASENSNYRKPGTGMGLHARKDYPDIDFSKCLMIGDSESDIEFGMKLGMKTIMLTTVGNVSTKADYIFKNLYQVSQALQ